MRLLASAVILLVSVLDLYFGAPNAALHIAGMVAGTLLALTVILDFLWLDPPARRRAAEQHTEQRCELP